MLKGTLVGKLSKLKVMKILEIEIFGCHSSVLNYLETVFFQIGKLLYNSVNIDSPLQGQLWGNWESCWADLRLVSEMLYIPRVWRIEIVQSFQDWTADKWVKVADASLCQPVILMNIRISYTPNWEAKDLILAGKEHLPEPAFVM